MKRLVLLLAFAVPATAGAQSRWQRQVDERLQRAISALRSSAGSSSITKTGTLNEEESARLEVTLVEGASYEIVGVCDDDCSRLQLTLTTPAGSELIQDRNSENLPTLRFTPNRTSLYRVRIVMEDCRFNPCWYAVGVVSQGSAP